MIKFWAGVTACLVGLCAGYGLASRNSSGTMSGINGPYTAGSVISSSVINARLADIETELTDSKSRSGKGDFSAPVRGADGTVTAPTFAFTSETGTGLYRIGSSDLGLSINQTKTGEWTANGYRTANGAVATPSLSFFNDTGGGLYRIGSNDFGFAVNGAKVQEWTATGSAFTGTLSATDAISNSVSGTGSTFLASFFEASLANGNSGTLAVGKANSANSSVGLQFNPSATAANSTGCLVVNGQTGTLCVDGNNAVTASGTFKVGTGSTTNGFTQGSCALNGGTPAQCTATVASSSRCTANVNTTVAANTRSLGTSVTATTLTVTSQTNGDTGTVTFTCF